MNVKKEAPQKMGTPNDRERLNKTIQIVKSKTPIDWRFAPLRNLGVGLKPFVCPVSGPKWAIDCPFAVVLLACMGLIVLEAS